jgi:hypothetical protein
MSPPGAAVILLVPFDLQIEVGEFPALLCNPSIEITWRE